MKPTRPQPRTRYDIFDRELKVGQWITWQGVSCYKLQVYIGRITKFTDKSVGVNELCKATAHRTCGYRFTYLRKFEGITIAPQGWEPADIPKET